MIARVDSATEQLLSKFSEIVALSEVGETKDRTGSVSDTFQIEANSTTMVRAAEDLLFVTRSLKEAWILGQVKPTEKADEDDEQTRETREKGEKLLKAILE